MKIYKIYDEEQALNHVDGVDSSDITVVGKVKLK